MATVYNEILKYCEKNDKVLPIKEEREKIGRDVASKYNREIPEDQKQIINKIKIRETDGEVWVKCYPDFFAPIIQDVIHKYYLSLSAVRKKRKRIPVSRTASAPTPVYSTNRKVYHNPQK